MKKLFLLIAACVTVMYVSAQEEVERASENKMAFVVEGPEDSYNQIRVVNHSSFSDFQCRVVYLNADNTVKALYGTYYLKGYDDVDSNTTRITRGQRIGIQMANDFPYEVTFSVEYKDYPFFDAILIYINDLYPGFDDTF